MQSQVQGNKNGKTKKRKPWKEGKLKKKKKKKKKDVQMHSVFNMIIDFRDNFLRIEMHIRVKYLLIFFL